MNGLKDEPGCRNACVARLNLLVAKSKPPVRLLIAPSNGSTATTAPCASGICASAQVPAVVGMTTITSPIASTSVTTSGSGPVVSRSINGLAQLMPCHGIVSSLPSANTTVALSFSCNAVTIAADSPPGTYWSSSWRTSVGHCANGVASITLVSSTFVSGPR